MSWKIRFYSGLNQAVDVPLDEGRVLIGTDPLLADLVLVDAGLAGVHLVLEVDAKGVRLLDWAAEHSPLQAGMPVVAGQALAAFSAQECGPLLWAYCERGQEFPAQLSVAGGAQERGSAAGFKARWGACILLGSSVLLLVLVASLMSDPWASGHNATALEAPEQLVRAYLRERQLLQVSVETREDGLAVLHGYVEDNQSRLALQQYLERNHLGYRLEVRSMEEIRQAVDVIVHRLGFRQVSSSNGDQPGWIRLTGELEREDETWAQIGARLKADVPGLLGVENQARLAGAPLRRLEQLLQEAGLGRLLALRDLSERIELRGLLNEAQLQKFSELQREFRREFGSRPALELINRADRGASEKLEFSLRSASFGHVPYVVLNDNRKYPVGSLTPQGVRVLAIEPGQIVVSKGQQQFIINLKVGVSHDDGARSASVRG